MEILSSVIAQRLGMQVAFGSGNVCYRETIAGAVEGIGHFEPLRHYAEVHLLLEPGEPGSGVTVGSACPDGQAGSELAAADSNPSCWKSSIWVC